MDEPHKQRVVASFKSKPSNRKPQEIALAKKLPEDSKRFSVRKIILSSVLRGIRRLPGRELD